MSDPYRTQALVKYEDVPKNVFKYYVMNDRRDDRPDCPVCNRVIYKDSPWGRWSEGVACYPTKRVVVKGFWWWRKRCPLPGVHIHFKCKTCGAISIRLISPEPASQLAPIPE